MRIKSLLLTTSALLSLSLALPVHAVTTSHSTGGHSTATHSTTTHTTASRGATTSATRSTTARPSSSTRTTSPSNSTHSTAATGRPTSALSRSVAKSTTYKSLSTSHQESYSTWRTNTNLRNINESSVSRAMRNYYFYYPYWMFITHNNSNVQKETNLIQTTAQQRDLKWIKVSNNIVYVPEKIFNKIKVGDSVKLIDNTHIQINNHTYHR